MDPQHLSPYESVLDTIGWTPLIRLGHVGVGIRTPVYGKAEHKNPGGSVKDRIGLAIIEGAERRGELKAGGVVVEATSGNTGVGLALVIPWFNSYSMFLGAFAAYLWERWRREQAEKYVVAISSGIIAGESLMGKRAGSIRLRSRLS